jgi:hypothetical protein
MATAKQKQMRAGEAEVANCSRSLQLFARQFAPLTTSRCSARTTAPTLTVSGLARFPPAQTRRAPSALSPFVSRSV